MQHEVIDKIQALALAGAGKLVQLDERTFSTTKLHEPPPPATPSVLAVSTLTGVVDWWQAEAEHVSEADPLVVHVAGPRDVYVRGTLHGRFQQRFDYVHAQAADLVDGWLGNFHEQEQFVIALQARFLAVEDDRARVLAFVGNLTEEKVKTVVDDGVSQVATARQGIAGLKEVKLPNLVTLHPRRTFAEVGAQPEQLVLRVREGCKAALFSADAGAWRLDAIRRVAAWLREHLPQGVSVIA